MAERRTARVAEVVDPLEGVVVVCVGAMVLVVPFAVGALVAAGFVATVGEVFVVA